MSRRIRKSISLALLILVAVSYSVLAQINDKDGAGKAGDTSQSGVKQKIAKVTPDDTPNDVLSNTEWKHVDAAVERALNWMAAQQQNDGAFPTLERGQPGVTSLCMMAFLSHGYRPGAGQFGARLERATDFVLRCQKQNGLVAALAEDT